MNKSERLTIFKTRLEAAALSATFDEANALISKLLTDVEDEFSGIANNPQNWMNDGRMYPVQNDNIRALSRNPRIRRLRSKAHETLIGDNGSIEIRIIASQLAIVDKPGADGKRVSEL